MINYNTTYKKYLNNIESFLIRYIPNIEPSELYEPFRYIISAGGKRIRPVLAMFCCGAVGGNPEDAIPVGAAIEIMHNFTLVHDDIMDKSDMRRGLLTIHKKWNEPVAILTGDLMVGYSYKLLQYYLYSPKFTDMYVTLCNGLIEVCEGQGYDMNFNSNKNVNADDNLLMIDKKTAKILETAAVLGALAGNAIDEQIKNIRNFANALGLAFQIQDDLLDLTADEKVLGKHIGQDIIEGKKTLLIIKAKEKATEKADIDLLNKFYENNGLGEENIPVIKEMMMRLGVIDEIAGIAEKYFEKAKLSLDCLEKNNHVELLYKFITSLNIRKF